MILLKLNKDDQHLINKNIVEYRKQFGKILSKSQQQSKLDYCYYCSKPTTKFCNSHFVPRFCLKNIAVDGEVLYSNSLSNFPILDTFKGINNAGTFKIICNDCDSKIFKEYEDPNKYDKIPTSQMLAQIAMKNYLKYISKRHLEKAMYNISAEISPFGQIRKEFTDNINSLDLKEYQKGYEKAKRIGKKDYNNDYYLFFHQILDYVAPIAFQSGIVLVSDLEGQIINNIYNLSPNYHPKEIHVCVFPLKNQTVVMMFIDSKDKRYRKFYKQFNKLELNQQLGIINYMIFLYTEDMFFSKSLPTEILNDVNLISTFDQTTELSSSKPILNPIQEAANKFNLNNWNTIPNLLNEKYKLR